MLVKVLPLRRSISCFVALIVLLGFPVPSTAGDEQSEPPQVGDRYQTAIDTAWDEAGAGDDPSLTCAAVKGRVAGTNDSHAFRALFACNVDVPTRYFNAYLDAVAAGEKSCPDLMREVMTKLPAMTMAADVVVEMAERLERDGEAELAVVDALGAAAGDSMENGELKNPKRLVKDRITERTRELCPDFADIILD